MWAVEHKAPGQLGSKAHTGFTVLDFQIGRTHL